MEKVLKKQNLIKKFPTFINFKVGLFNRIKKVLENIKNDSLTVGTVWYKGANNATIDKIIEDISDCIMRRRRREFEENVFIKTVTSQGNEIIFSFELGGSFAKNRGWFTAPQSFFLYKGSEGQPGGHGGECGLGGEGGYPGEITVRNSESGQELSIIKNAKRGEEGEKGQGGL
jgi:hypothetical protein